MNNNNNIFSEAIIDWDNAQQREYCFAAIGTYYRESNRNLSHHNISMVCNCLLWLWNLDYHNFKKNPQRYAKQHEFIRVPYLLAKESLKGGISYFLWKKFLDFAKEMGILEIKKGYCHATFIKINFQRLKDIAVDCLNEYAHTFINIFYDDEENSRFWKAFRQVKNLAQFVQNQIENIRLIDLPDNFSKEEREKFAEFATNYAKKRHKKPARYIQRLWVDKIIELKNRGLDTLYALQQAINHKWARVYDYTQKEEKRPFISQRRNYHQELRQIASYFNPNSS